MKFLLECVILEITTKSFRNREGADQLYYVAQCYQPGVGVDEISMEKDFANSDMAKIGKAGIYTVELRNGKPRIVGLIK